jgi:hypothetical protein
MLLTMMSTSMTAGGRTIEQHEHFYLHERRNTEARSRNHCYSGKAISITHSVFVCVCLHRFPACNAHATYYVAFSCLSGSKTFLQIIS